MTSIRLAKLCFVTVAVAACLPIGRSAAGNFAYMSATGGGLTCAAAAPCATFLDAFAALVPNSGRILCLDPVADTQSMTLSVANASFDIDCPAGSWAGNSSIVPVLKFTGSNLTLTFRNMTFNGVGGATSAIGVGSGGSGTLIFENCAFANFSGLALDIAPAAALNIVIRNSRISNSGGGIRLKPAAGGSITATFDHVTFTGNGGGIRADSTDGTVDLDVTDSVISNNTSNGIVAIAGINQNIVSIKSSVIAKNGAAGVVANGVNAGVLVATTLLDQNVTGATSVVSSGNIFTYGNNDIVGSIGSGFTATAALH